MKEPVCFLNGDFLPLAAARIPVLDRGFIFGDGVYEVIPVFHRVPFRFEEHLARLEASLASVYIDPPMTRAQWVGVCEHIVAENGYDDQSVYIQVTRGVAPRNHVLNESVRPTVFAMSTELVTPAEPQPISAITLDDLRWARCDIKSVSLIANVIAREEAARAGAGEAILVRDGRVTEGAASNVFVALDGVIRTPPLSPEILPGITRDLLCELLIDGTPRVLAAPVSVDELRAAEEIWVTSSSRELVPVVMLDGVAVGDGKPGPAFAAVLEAYRRYKAGLHASP